MSRAGAHFEHYRLDRLIGTGGMGQVWLAYDTTIERDVALKLLRADLSADESYRRRFEREARIAAGLREPHVIPIHGFGTVQDRLYIDMALIDGTDANSLLRHDGPLSAARAVDVVEQVASALDAAHRAGLLHRDVKPSNILVHDSGFVYLIDFGIAGRVGQSSSPDAGATLGTLAYMAPERLTGTDSVSADVYSLACVLFECLTGVRPFGDTSRDEQINAHLRMPPPSPSDVRPGVPVGFDLVVARGMAKDPQERYRSARELATAARAALGAGPDRIPAPTRDIQRDPDVTPQLAHRSEPTIVVTQEGPDRVDAGGRRRTLLIPLVAAAVVAVGATVFFLWPESDSVDQGSAVASGSRVAATIEVGNGPAGVAVDPATHAVYVTNSDDGSVSVIDGLTNTVAASVEVGADPAGVAFDPTTHAAYVTNRGDGSVSVIDAGTVTVTTTVAVGARPVDVALDSSVNTAYVANFDDGSVSVIDTATGAVTTTVGVGKSPQSVAVNPSAQTAYVANAADGSVSVIDTATGAVTTTVEVGKSPQSVAVDPEERTAYVTDFDADSVSVIDTSDNTARSTIDVGKAPRSVAVDQSAHRAYVANFADGSVSVIDTTTDTVSATIEVGAAPVSIAIDSSTHAVYVVAGDSVVVLSAE